MDTLARAWMSSNFDRRQNLVFAQYLEYELTDEGQILYYIINDKI